MRTIDQVIASLPLDQRSKVEARGQTLIAEEIALRHLRRARDLTQENMAARLNIDQAGISKIESRSDMLLSTLRSYVEAMGGSLRLTVEFAEGAVELETIGDVADREPVKRRSRKPTSNDDRT